MSFYIDTENLDTTDIKRELAALGWREDAVAPEFILITESKRFDKKMAYKAARLKSIIDTRDTISDKWVLYCEIMKAYPKARFFAKSYNNAAAVRFGRGQLYIVRPVEGFGGGGGITVVRDMVALKKVVEGMRRRYKKTIMVSEYIRDPLLYHGRICHLRVNMIMGRILGRTVAYMARAVRIATAAEAFDLSRVHLAAVHDSHMTSTGRYIAFPDDYVSAAAAAAIVAEIRAILTKAATVFADKIVCYAESENCFEVLGADFMLRRGGAAPKSLRSDSVVLIEINHKVSLKYITREMSDAVLGDVVSQFVRPIWFGEAPGPTRVWDRLI